MPLSKPVRRSLQHNRQVQCQGYQRDDGLWDIEGQMRDTKATDITSPEREGGYLAAGEPFHDMWIRFTIDRHFVIHHVEAVTDAAPFRICPNIASAFSQLEGTSIGPGWFKQAKQRLSGTAGCTHLVELLMPIATTAVQTLWPTVAADVMKQGATAMLNSCHGWSEQGEVVARYLPEYYQPATGAKTAVIAKSR